MKRRTFRVTIPNRLLPYLEDMTRGGLWGLDLRQTVIYAVQCQVQQEVSRGAIPNRIHGKVARRPA